MRKLLLGLSIGLASLLVGGVTVALFGIAVLAPLAAAVFARPRRSAPGSQVPGPASLR